MPDAAGQSQVVFAFHYKSPGNRWWWAVDSIAVSGTTEICDARECGLREFGVAYDPETATVSGSWQLLPGDESFRVLEGERVVAELAGDATSFSDASPPPSGEGVVYTLETFTGGAFDRACESNEIDTFTPATDLACRADQGTRTLELSFDPGSNQAIDGFLVLVNGLEAARLRPEIGELSQPLTGEDLAVSRGVVDVDVVPFVESPASELAALSCRSVFSTGTVFFWDDFEDYATDADLEIAGWFIVDENEPLENAAWTVTNPSGRSNPPIFDGSPSSGSFVISDSDFADDSNPPGSGMSHDLWSPTFGAAKGGGAGEPAGSLWLHMDVSAQLNNNGEAIFDVDVSADGGLEWTNVFRRIAPARTVEPLPTNADADGYFGRLDLDISSFAGAPSLRFRVRHTEPNDDWWIAVDNVLVDDVPALSGGSEIFFSEDFDDGVGAMTADSLIDPPNSGTETWHTTDKGARFAPGVVSERGVNRLEQPDGAEPDFAILDSDIDPDPLEDEWLLTPVLDLSGAVEVFLHFESETVVSGDVQEVLVSVDGGATFDGAPLFSYTAGALYDYGEEPFYAERVLSAPQAAGEPSVVFAFHWVGQNEWWWAVDSVRVTGELAVTGGRQFGGDCNQDGAIDLSDAVCLFGYLFLGAPEQLPCGAGEKEDASNIALLDWNDDSTIDLSDGIAELIWLFSGGDPHPSFVNDEPALILIDDCPDFDAE